MSPRLLIAAPIPALLGSFLLLSLAAAPRAFLVQQVIVSVIAIVATIFSARYLKSSLALRTMPWFLVAMAALVCAPILSASATPHRWLGLFGFHLYVTPVVLPLFLLLWNRALSGDTAAVGLSSVAGLSTGMGSLAQPDAAQLTAFAMASIPLLWFTGGRPLVKLLALAALLIAAAVS